MKTTEALNNAISEREAHMQWNENKKVRTDEDYEEYTEQRALSRIITRTKEYQEEAEERENKFKKYEKGIGKRILPNVTEDFARETVRRAAEIERENTHERHPGTKFEPGYRTDGNGEYRVEQAGYQVGQREIELYNERKEYHEAFEEQTKQQSKEKENFKS